MVTAIFNSMGHRMVVGRRGEDIALQYLENRGYQLEARNFRQGGGEIDLIMSRENLLIFVEVKTRSGKEYGLPEHMLGTRQEQKIVETAENYLLRRCWDKDIRFDLIGIVLAAVGNAVLDIVHFRDAY